MRFEPSTRLADRPRCAVPSTSVGHGTVDDEKSMTNNGSFRNCVPVSVPLALNRESENVNAQCPVTWTRPGNFSPLSNTTVAVPAPITELLTVPTQVPIYGPSN